MDYSYDYTDELGRSVEAGRGGGSDTLFVLVLWVWNKMVVCTKLCGPVWACLCWLRCI